MPGDTGDTSGGINQDLVPYIQQEQQDRQAQENVRNPVQFVLDLLMAGPYATSNAALDITDSVEQGRPFLEALGSAFAAAGRGLISPITNDRTQMHSWKDVVTRWAPESAVPRNVYGQEVSTGPSAADILGFVGDIVADPFTYVNPVSWIGKLRGLTGIARNSLNRFSQDIVRLTAANIGRDIGEQGLVDVAERGTTREAIQSIEDLFRRQMGAENYDAVRAAQQAGNHAEAQRILKRSLPSQMPEIINRSIRDATNRFATGGATEGHQIAGGLINDMLHTDALNKIGQAAPDLAQSIRNILNQNVVKNTAEVYDGIRALAGTDFTKALLNEGARNADEAVKKLIGNKLVGTVTIDNLPEYAKSIAEKLGRMNPKQAQALLKNIDEFARLNPQLAQEIRTAIQSADPVTAVQKLLEANQGISRQLSGMEGARSIESMIGADLKKGGFYGLVRKTFSEITPTEISSLESLIPGISRQASEVMTGDVAKNLTDIVSKLPADNPLVEKLARALRISDFDSAMFSGARATAPDNFRSLIEGIRTGERYPLMGQRKLGSVFGHDFGLASPDKPGPLNSFLQGAAKLGSTIGSLPEQLFNASKRIPVVGNITTGLEALASRIQSGPMAEIAQKFGFYNPYQKMLRAIELDAGQNFYMRAAQNGANRVLQIMNSGDMRNPEVQRSVTAVNEIVENINAHSVKKITPQDVVNFATTGQVPDPSLSTFLTNEVSRTRLKLTPQTAESVIAGADAIRGEMNNLQKQMLVFEGEGFGTHAGELEEYLPIEMKNMSTSGRGVRTVGSANASYTKERVFTRAENVSQEAAKYRMLWPGLSDDAIDGIIRDGNASGIEMNLQNMLMLREFAQAAYAKRVNILRAFKEYGVPVKFEQEVTDGLRQAMGRGGATLQQLGLAKIPQKGLEDMFFDPEIRRILTVVDKGTAPGAIQAIRKMWASYMGGWKGLVTLSPGFHVRNFTSNTLTTWIRSGISAFSPSNINEASMVAWYADRDGQLLKELSKRINRDVSESEAMLFLNSRKYGTYSLKDIADEMLRDGTLSGGSMVGTARSATEQIAKMTTPAETAGQAIRQGLHNVPRDIMDFNRRIGSFLENFSKAQMALDTYKKTLRGMEDEATRAWVKAPTEAMTEKMTVRSTQALRYATMDARKWLIDYNDLTQWEQTIMKNVIPFYSWLRHNIVNQLHMLWLYPEAMTIIPKLQEAFTEEDPNYDPSLLPAWMKEQNMYPEGKMPGGWLMKRPDIALMDLNLLPIEFNSNSPNLFAGAELNTRHTIGDLVNTANPLLKVAMSLITQKGYDFFKREELQDYTPTSSILDLIVKTPVLAGAADAIYHFVNPQDDKPIFIREGNGRYSVNSEFKLYSETLFPIIKTMEYVLDAGGTVASTVSSALMHEMATTESSADQYQRLNRVYRALGKFTGTRYYPLDEQNAREGRAREIYYAAQGNMVGERRRTVAGIEHRAEYNQRLNRTMRRYGLL